MGAEKGTEAAAGVGMSFSGNADLLLHGNGKTRDTGLAVLAVNGTNGLTINTNYFSNDGYGLVSTGKVSIAQGARVFNFAPGDANVKYKEDENPGNSLLVFQNQNDGEGDFSIDGIGETLKIKDGIFFDTADLKVTHQGLIDSQADLQIHLNGEDFVQSGGTVQADGNLYLTGSTDNEYRITNGKVSVGGLVEMKGGALNVGKGASFVSVKEFIGPSRTDQTEEGIIRISDGGLLQSVNKYVDISLAELHVRGGQTSSKILAKEGIDSYTGPDGQPNNPKDNTYKGLIQVRSETQHVKLGGVLFDVNLTDDEGIYAGGTDLWIGSRAIDGRDETGSIHVNGGTMTAGTAGATIKLEADKDIGLTGVKVGVNEELKEQGTGIASVKLHGKNISLQDSVLEATLDRNGENNATVELLAEGGAVKVQGSTLNTWIDDKSAGTVTIAPAEDTTATIDVKDSNIHANVVTIGRNNVNALPVHIRGTTIWTEGDGPGGDKYGFTIWGGSGKNGLTIEDSVILYNDNNGGNVTLAGAGDICLENTEIRDNVGSTPEDPPSETKEAGKGTLNIAIAANDGTISLVGSTLDDDTINLGFETATGNVDISLAKGSSVHPDAGGDGLSVFADSLTLTGASHIGESSNGRPDGTLDTGSVKIAANTIELTGASYITTQKEDVTIGAPASGTSVEITLDESSWIKGKKVSVSTGTTDPDVGPSGTVTITGGGKLIGEEELKITGEEVDIEVGISTGKGGAAGTLIVEGGDVSIDVGEEELVVSGSGSHITGKPIDITGGKVTVDKGGVIETSGTGTGTDDNKITITTDEVFVGEESRIGNSGADVAIGPGNGGNLAIGIGGSGDEAGKIEGDDIEIGEPGGSGSVAITGSGGGIHAEGDLTIHTGGPDNVIDDVVIESGKDLLITGPSVGTGKPHVSITGGTHIGSSGDLTFEDVIVDIGGKAPSTDEGGNEVTGGSITIGGGSEVHVSGGTSGSNALISTGSGGSGDITVEGKLEVGDGGFVKSEEDLTVGSGGEIVFTGTGGSGKPTKPGEEELGTGTIVVGGGLDVTGSVTTTDSGTGVVIGSGTGTGDDFLISVGPGGFIGTGNGGHLIVGSEDDVEDLIGPDGSGLTVGSGGKVEIDGGTLQTDKVTTGSSGGSVEIGGSGSRVDLDEYLDEDGNLTIDIDSGTGVGNIRIDVSEETAGDGKTLDKIKEELGDKGVITAGGGEGNLYTEEELKKDKIIWTGSGLNAAKPSDDSDDPVRDTNEVTGMGGSYIVGKVDPTNGKDVTITVTNPDPSTGNANTVIITGQQKPETGDPEDFELVRPENGDDPLGGKPEGSTDIVVGDKTNLEFGSFDSLGGHLSGSIENDGDPNDEDGNVTFGNGDWTIGGGIDLGKGSLTFDDYSEKGHGRVDVTVGGDVSVGQITSEGGKDVTFVTGGKIDAESIEIGGNTSIGKTEDGTDASLDVENDLIIRDDASVNRGDIDVGGNVWVGTKPSTGNPSLHAEGTLDIGKDYVQTGGRTDVTDSMTVGGKFEQTGGIANVGGDLTVSSGGTTIGGTTTVGGKGSFTGDLTVLPGGNYVNKGVADDAFDTVVTGNVTVGTDGAKTEASAQTGDLKAEGDITVKNGSLGTGKVETGGNVTVGVGGTFNAAGDVTLTGNDKNFTVEMGGVGTIGGDLSVGKDLEAADGSLTVSGAGTVGGDLTVGNGDATTGRTEVNFGGKLDVTGETTVMTDGNLTAGGNAAFAGGLDIDQSGEFVGGGDTLVGDHLTMGPDSTLAAEGTLSFKEQTQVGKDGNGTLKGTVSAGAIDFSNATPETIRFEGGLTDLDGDGVDDERFEAGFVTSDLTGKVELANGASGVLKPAADGKAPTLDGFIYVEAGDDADKSGSTLSTSEKFESTSDSNDAVLHVDGGIAFATKDTASGIVLGNVNPKPTESGVYIGDDAVFNIDASSMANGTHLFTGSDGKDLLVTNVKTDGTVEINLTGWSFGTSGALWMNVGAENVGDFEFASSNILQSFGFNEEGTAIRMDAADVGGVTDGTISGKFEDVVNAVTNAASPGYVSEAFDKIFSAAQGSEALDKEGDGYKKLVEDLKAQGLVAEDFAGDIVMTDFGYQFTDKDGKTKFHLNGTANQAIGEIATFPVVSGNFNAAYDYFAEFNRAVENRTAASVGEGRTAWASVIATRNKADTLFGASGYEADLYGGVFGADVLLTNGTTLGAALTIGTGDYEAVGSVVASENDATFYGVSFYAEREFAGLKVKGDVGFLRSENDVTGSFEGVDMGGKSDTDAVSFGVRAEFTAFEGDTFDVKPHFGVRYTNYAFDSYRGTEVRDVNVLEAPLGVAVEGKGFAAAGWTLAPKADFTVTAQMADKKAEVVNAGVAVGQQVLSGALAQGAFGLEASKENFTFAVDYRLGVGNMDRMNNALQLNATWTF